MPSPGKTLSLRALHEANLKRVFKNNMQDWIVKVVASAGTLNAATLTTLFTTDVVLQSIRDLPPREKVMVLGLVRDWDLVARMTSTVDEVLAFSRARGWDERTTKQAMEDAITLRERGQRPNDWGETAYESDLDRMARNIATATDSMATKYRALAHGKAVRWISKRDDKVRQTHDWADGQTIRPDSYFVVGGFLVEFPGDPSAPPQERINCRCVLIIVDPVTGRPVSDAELDRETDAALEQITEEANLTAGGSPAQARIKKGNPGGGQWTETPGSIYDDLVTPRGAELGESYTSAVQDALDELDTGLTAKVSRVVENNAGRTTLIIDLADADGNIADPNTGLLYGGLRRQFYPDDKKVYNWQFTLHRDLQGKGIGSKITEHTDDRLRELGFETIELTANIDVGGYTWARQGFEFARPVDADNVFAAMQFNVPGGWNPYKKQENPNVPESLDWALWQEFDDLHTRHAAGEKILPADIAQIGWTEGASTWLGKEGMLGSEWNGVKHLNPVDEPVTAAGGPSQARVLKGNRDGGQWIDTPSGVLADMGTWSGEDEGGAYFVPDVDAGHGTGGAVRDALPDPNGDDFDFGAALALGHYSSDNGKGINDFVRDGGLERGENGFLSGVVKDLDGGFEGSHTTEDALFYRGLDGSAFGGADMNDLLGKVIRDKGYLSTTTDDEIAYQFAGWKNPVIMEIKVPAGTPAIKVGGDMALYGDRESEVLFPRDLPIAITGVENLGGEWRIKATVGEKDDTLTAAGGPAQARVLKGNRDGGQWIDTPNGLLHEINQDTRLNVVDDAKGTGWANEHPDAPDAEYFVPNLKPDYADLTALDEQMPESAFSDEERNVLREYTKHHNEKLNSALRGTDGMTPELQERIALMDQALDRQTIPHDMFLKRVVPLWSLPVSYEPPPGVSAKDWNEQRMRSLIGTVMQDSAYLSTSMDPDFEGANKWLPYFNIEVPAGSKGAWLEPFTQWPTEREILLPRDTPLAITDVSQDENGAWVIDAVVAEKMEDDDLTAAGFIPMRDTAMQAHRQARAPKGTTIGGQWIDTPNAILEDFGWEENAGRGYVPDRVGDPLEHYALKGALDRDLKDRPLTDSQKNAISEYTRSSGLVNRVAREGGSDDLDDLNRFNQVGRELDGILLDGSALPADGTFWRGFKDARFPTEPDELDGLVGQVIADKGFLSTSVDKFSGERFAGSAGNPMLKISAGKGQPAIWMEPHTSQGGEWEVLFPRDTPLAITGWYMDEETGRPIIEVTTAREIEDLTASGQTFMGENQARILKGNPGGGQWVDTPNAINLQLIAQDRQATLDYMAAHRDDPEAQAAMMDAVRAEGNRQREEAARLDAEEVDPDDPRWVGPDDEADIFPDRPEDVGDDAWMEPEEEDPFGDDLMWQDKTVEQMNGQDLYEMTAEAVEGPLREYGITVIDNGSGGDLGDAYTSLKLIGPEGEFVGRIERAVSADGVVENSIFTLEPEWQGKGIASKLTPAMEDAWRDKGYTEVVVHANIDVGGYTWARQGFKFANSWEVPIVLDRVREGAGWPDVDPDDWDDNPHPLDSKEHVAWNDYRDIRSKLDAGEEVLPAEIAGIGWTEGAESWPGKDGMLGSDWQGYKDLYDDPYGEDGPAYSARTLTAAGGSPAQARILKGNPDGGQWTETPGAILKSLNRLESGSDIGDAVLPGSEAELDAYRRELSDEILAREGRPGVGPTSERVGEIYDLTDEAQRNAADHWYDEANDLAADMVERSGGTMTMEQAAAIIAHTSTRTEWGVNRIIAQTIAGGGSMDDAVAAIQKAKDDGLINRRGMPMQANWDRALKAAASGDPIGLRDGSLGTFGEGANKTRNFAGNILGDTDGVTVDTWMYRVLGQSDEVKGKMEGVPIRIREDQVYEALSESVRVAAKDRGVDPVDMQAATWLWMLENYHPSRGGNPGYILDDEGNTFPLTIEEERELAASGFPVGPEVYYLDSEVIDYFYAQAEAFGFLPPRFLTAAAPDQARAPKGSKIGGQWIDTPAGILSDLNGNPVPKVPGIRDKVRDQGGASISPITGKEPTDGYMVAVQGRNLEVPEDVFFGEGGEDALYGWIEANIDALSEAGAHIGLWHDTENGEVVFDVSQRVSDIEEAIRLGRERNQQAVWDVENGEEIDTGGTGDRQPDDDSMSAIGVHHDRPATALRAATRGVRRLARGAEARVRPRTDRDDLAARIDRLTTFAPAQLRAPKGSAGGHGGEWIDSPTKVLGDLTNAYGKPVGATEIGRTGITPKRTLENNAPIYAMEGANPNYGADPDYRVNCQKATAVYELRRRGMDVTADGGLGPHAGTRGVPQYFLMGGVPKRVDWTKQQSPDTGGMMRNIVGSIGANFPAGSRGFITMGLNTGGGHIMSWELDALGDIHFVDGQSGEDVTFDMAFWENVNPSNIAFDRLDDKALSEGVLDAINPDDLNSPSQD